MRRQFFCQCALSCVALMLFGGVVVILDRLHPPVESAISSTPPTLEEFIETFEEGRQRMPIPSKKVPTIRIFDPLEAVP